MFALCDAVTAAESKVSEAQRSEEELRGTVVVGSVHEGGMPEEEEEEEGGEREKRERREEKVGIPSFH